MLQESEEAKRLNVLMPPRQPELSEEQVRQMSPMQRQQYAEQSQMSTEMNRMQAMNQMQAMNRMQQVRQEDPRMQAMRNMQRTNFGTFMTMDPRG
jgi:hypothetical protein